MANFNIIEDGDYWSDYETFIEEYNNHELLVKEIREKLNISQRKYLNYRKRAIEEGRLVIRKQKNRGSPLSGISKKQYKIFNYVQSTWFDMQCKDKAEVKKIIAREILANPDMGFKKLCLHCKRQCMVEL